MVLEEEFKTFTAHVERIIRGLKDELASLRTNRPTPALVEDIPVECYGTRMRMKEVAAILVEPPNSLVIQPWDRANLQAIERALATADLGVSPIVDGASIRITLPPLTEERRRELVRILGKKAEEARIAFRLARDEVRKSINRLASQKQISEDEKFRAQERLDKEAEDFGAKIEAIVAEKEKEILRV
jgi:ribosome recycling factor